MKKFSFSLQKLLGYKEQLFDIEQIILGDMNAVLAQLQNELDNLEREHALRSREYNEIMANGTTPLELERYKNYMMQVDYSIKQKLAQIEMQKLAIDKQMDKVREAKIEISTIEKLREKKIEEYTYMENKEGEQFIEEYVTSAKAMAYGN